MGRSSAYTVAVQTLLLVLASLLNDEVDGVVHTVGGSSRWDLGVDYTVWAAGETFAVGDVLFFSYQPDEHDVVVVSKAGYDACSRANAINTYNTGNDNVTLTSAGAHYYLCSVVGHCGGGMKLAVNVVAATTPVPVPVPVPAPTPTPTPVPVPSASVSPTPSPTVPTPAPAPVPILSAATTPPAPSSAPSSSPSTTSSPTSPPPPPPAPAPPNSAPLISSPLTLQALTLASLLLAAL